MPYTPGPWEFNEDDGNIEDIEERPVVRMQYAWMEDEYSANAHLVAAAPELLEALKYLLKVRRIACLHPSQPIPDEICAKCRAKAAIAKAEGQ
jgi:hypothetical protein